MRPHIALFSFTGTEIVNVAKSTMKWPNLIATNKRPKTKRAIHMKMPDVYELPSNPTSEDYRRVFELFKDPVITLHGWMKIVPKDICKEYEIYNGHPGDIALHPELKGKDPQKRAYELGLSFTGNTIHRVTPKVDSGQIMFSSNVKIEGLSLNEIIHTLHEDATNLWTIALPQLLKEKE